MMSEVGDIYTYGVRSGTNSTHCIMLEVKINTHGVRSGSNNINENSKFLPAPNPKLFGNATQRQTSRKNSELFLRHTTTYFWYPYPLFPLIQHLAG